MAKLLHRKVNEAIANSTQFANKQVGRFTNFLNGIQTRMLKHSDKALTENERLNVEQQYFATKDYYNNEPYKNLVGAHTFDGKAAPTLGQNNIPIAEPASRVVWQYENGQKAVQNMWVGPDVLGGEPKYFEGADARTQAADYVSSRAELVNKFQFDIGTMTKESREAMTDDDIRMLADMYNPESDFNKSPYVENPTNLADYTHNMQKDMFTAFQNGYNSTVDVSTLLATCRLADIYKNSNDLPVNAMVYAKLDSLYTGLPEAESAKTAVVDAYKTDRAKSCDLSKCGRLKYSTFEDTALRKYDMTPESYGELKDFDTYLSRGGELSMSDDGQMCGYAVQDREGNVTEHTFTADQLSAYANYKSDMNTMRENASDLQMDSHNPFTKASQQGLIDRVGRLSRGCDMSQQSIDNMHDIVSQMQSAQRDFNVEYEAQAKEFGQDGPLPENVLDGMSLSDIKTAFGMDDAQLKKMEEYDIAQASGELADNPESTLVELGNDGITSMDISNYRNYQSSCLARSQQIALMQAEAGDDLGYDTDRMEIDRAMQNMYITDDYRQELADNYTSYHPGAEDGVMKNFAHGFVAGAQVSQGTPNMQAEVSDVAEARQENPVPRSQRETPTSTKGRGHEFDDIIEQQGNEADYEFE